MGERSVSLFLFLLSALPPGGIINLHSEKPKDFILENRKNKQPASILKGSLF